MPLRCALKCLPLWMTMTLVLVGNAAAQAEPKGRVDVTITLRGEGSWTDDNGDATAVRIDRRLEASIALQGARSAGNPIDARRTPDVGEQMASAEQQMALAREAQACGQNVACLQKLATRIAGQQRNRATAAARGTYYSVWSSHPFDSSGCVLTWNERIDDTLRRSWRPAGEPRTDVMTVRANNQTPSSLLPYTQTPPVCSWLAMLAVESGTGAWTFSPVVLLSATVRAEITERAEETRTRTDFAALLGAPTGTAYELLPERNPHLAGLNLPDLVLRGTGPVQGDTTIRLVLGRAPETVRLELTVSWRARLDEDDVRIAIEGPACGCMNAEDAQGETLRFTATASEPGGTFTRFAVRPVGDAPREIVNEGGSTARLDLAAARGTDAVTLAVTYERDGKQYQAEHRLELCVMDSIRFAGGHRDHTFDDSQPGRLEVRASAAAWHNGQEISPELVWRLEAMGSGTTLDPGDATGGTVVLAYSGLPERNDAFGEKTVTARVEKGACACEREAKIRTFYPALATNHPSVEGSEHRDAANFFFYYMQTAAAEGINTTFYRYRKDLSTIPGNGSSTIATFVPREDRIYIGEPVFTLGCRGPASPGTRAHTLGNQKIDCFGETLRHEWQHRVDYRTWWPDGYHDPSESYGWDFIPALGFALLNDADGDKVPADVEAKLPGCRDAFSLDEAERERNTHSCDGRPFDDVIDLEVFAYYTGWKWQVGKADKEDWACGGKQWRGGACPK